MAGRGPAWPPLMFWGLQGSCLLCRVAEELWTWDWWGPKGQRHPQAFKDSPPPPENSKQYPGQADCDLGHLQSKPQENGAVQGPAMSEIQGNPWPTRADSPYPVTKLPPAEA